MSEITTMVSTLKAKADELRELNEVFKGQREELMSTHEALNGMWEGEAKAAFDQAFKRDMIQFQNFYNAINGYVEALEDIANNYSMMEARNIELARERCY